MCSALRDLHVELCAVRRARPSAPPGRSAAFIAIRNLLHLPKHHAANCTIHIALNISCNHHLAKCTAPFWRPHTALLIAMPLYVRLQPLPHLGRARALIGLQGRGNTRHVHQWCHLSASQHHAWCRWRGSSWAAAAGRRAATAHRCCIWRCCLPRSCVDPSSVPPTVTSPSTTGWRTTARQLPPHSISSSCCHSRRRHCGPCAAGVIGARRLDARRTSCSRPKLPRCRTTAAGLLGACRLPGVAPAQHRGWRWHHEPSHVPAVRARITTTTG